MTNTDTAEREVELPIDEDAGNEEESNPTIASEDAQLGSKAEQMMDNHESSSENERLRNQSEASEGKQEFDPEQEGIEEAKRVKSEMEGSEAEKTQKALQAKSDSLNNFKQEIRETKQRLVRLQKHRDNLQSTVERVEEASEDHTVMEHLDGQVASVEVKPNERDDFLDRLQDKVDETEEEIEGVVERGNRLQRGLQKDSVSYRFLEQHLDNIGV